MDDIVFVAWTASLDARDWVLFADIALADPEFYDDGREQLLAARSQKLLEILSANRRPHERIH